MMIDNFFAVGSVWLWILLVVFGICAIKTARDEIVALHLIQTGLFFAVLILFGDFNIFCWISQNTIVFGVCLLIYVFVGILWSFAKWIFFLISVRDAYFFIREWFKIDHDIHGKIPDEILGDWSRHISNITPWTKYLIDGHYDSHYELYYRHLRSHRDHIGDAADLIPRPENYCQTILFWILFWPFSLLYYPVYFMLMIELKFLIKFRLTALYNIVSNWIFREIENDFTQEKQIE